MKSRRRRMILLTVILLSFTGCGTKNEVVNYEAPTEYLQTLSFFGNKYEAANVEVIEDILNGYMQDHDVFISYESIKGSSYYDALKNRKDAKRLDDIFMVNHDTALEFFRHGILADLTDLAKDVPFSDSMLSQMESEDGCIYWVPTTVSAFGLYCNLNLLELHGQDVPRSLGEWEAACSYFTSKGITPIVANNDISIKTLALAKGFYPLYKEGRQIEAFERLNKGEEALSSYLKEGFSLVMDFCRKGYIDAKKALKTEKTSDDLEEFAQGKSPFLLTGAWAARRLKDMEHEFEFQVVPYPILEDGSVLVINPDVRLSVSAFGDHQETAKNFISYFLQEDNIARFADNQSSFSPLKNEFQPSLTEIHDIVASYRDFTPVIGSDSHIAFPIWDITTDVSKGLLAGEGLDSLMKKMDEQAMPQSD